MGGTWQNDVQGTSKLLNVYLAYYMCDSLWLNELIKVTQFWGFFPLNFICMLFAIYVVLIKFYYILEHFLKLFVEL